ncbi:hypothetical protein LC607_14650 [Nostoc sp. CHAB 5824]|nr:hypothetical protein [Nostoc sp. CHAB 5824]
MSTTGYDARDALYETLKANADSLTPYSPLGILRHASPLLTLGEASANAKRLQELREDSLSALQKPSFVS